MPNKTRQQRRAEAREAAKLLVQGDHQGFRWDYTLAFSVAVIGLFLVLAPPETPRITALWLVVMFGMLTYPTLHLVKAVFRMRVKRIQVAVALFLSSGLVTLFSWWLFRAMPIELQFSSTVPRYSPGSDINGIHWDDKYSELRLVVRNLSDADYNDLDLAITSDLMFADLRQENGLASCIIAPEGEPFPNVTSQTLVGGRPVGLADTSGEAYKSVAVDANGQVISISGNIKRTYRIRCEKFPSHNQSSFIGALVVVNPFSKERPPKELLGIPKAANLISTQINFKPSGHPKKAVILSCMIGQICKT